MKETQENTPLAVATVVLGIVVGFNYLISLPPRQSANLRTHMLYRLVNQLILSRIRCSFDSLTNEILILARMSLAIVIRGYHAVIRLRPVNFNERRPFQ